MGLAAPLAIAALMGGFLGTLPPPGLFMVLGAGRGNAHDHPHAAVVRRFRAAGSCLWNTASDGAVTLWLGRSESIPVVTQRPVPGRAAVSNVCAMR